MSYILDALRKAEMERALTRVSSIASPRLDDPLPGRRRTRQLIYFVITMACAITLTWWWARHDVTQEVRASAIGESGTEKQTENVGTESTDEGGREEVPNRQPSFHSTPSSPPRTATLPRPDAASIAALSAVRKAEVSPVLKVADVHTTKPHSGVSRAATNKSVRESAGESVRVVEKDSVPAMPQEADLSSPPIGKQDDENNVMAMIAREAEQFWSSPVGEKPSPSLSPQAETGSTEAPTEEKVPEDETIPPLLSTLPYRFQRIVPEIVINAQAYADEVEARFVIINMKKYREGQRTEEGLIVEHISKEYLVLSYQGQSFRLQR